MPTCRAKNMALLALAAILLFICGWLPDAGAQENAASKPSENDAQYVGSEVCKSCHEEVHQKFSASPHAHLLSEKNVMVGNVEAHGCESCHGPGSAHVEGGGDKTKIVKFSDLTPEKASAQCQQCHQDGDHSNFGRSAHLQNGIGCNSCHSVHEAKAKRSLLREDSPKLCYSCHTEMKAEFSRPYRHRVNEGLVRCADCHNEHGGFLPKQLRTSASQDQVCFKCHTEKKGPFVYEHLPVKTEGCTSCHSPHGSTNPRLLKVTQVNLLCLQCHTLSLNNIPSQPPVGPAHNQATKYQACTMCHAYIHGSNFSEVYFKP
jgi:DmsE family decaheme c-type cytochrome